MQKEIRKILKLTMVHLNTLKACFYYNVIPSMHVLISLRSSAIWEFLNFIFGLSEVFSFDLDRGLNQVTARS